MSKFFAMARLGHLCLIPVLVLTAGVEAWSAPTSLNSANLSPVVQVYGLPRITEGPHPTSKSRLQLDLDWASHAIRASSQHAQVHLDGETQRYTLSAMGPWPPDSGSWWALEIPWVRHTAGQLDGPIDAWHNAFGLPEGERVRLPSNALDFQVVDASSKRLLHQSERASGLGDIAVSGGFPLYPRRGDGPGIDVGFRIEAPTGDPHRLLGSGGWDLASWLSATNELGFGKGWSWHTAAGTMYMTDTRILGPLHRKRAFFGRIAAHWAMRKPLGWTIQLDGHTALYNSPLVPLGGAALQLRLGSEWRPWANYRIEAGFSEDLAVGTAPDIVFHLGLSRTY